jgi:hypothetical protein
MNQTKLKTMCAALREMRREYAGMDKEKAALPKRGFFPSAAWLSLQKQIDANCGLQMRQERAILDYVMGESK